MKKKGKKRMELGRCKREHVDRLAALVPVQDDGWCTSRTDAARAVHFPCRRNIGVLGWKLSGPAARR